MKVFNWVNRRFMNVQSYTGFQQDVAERGGSSKTRNERHILLGHDAHMVVDMIDQWNDGILSIGTISISPLEANCKYGILDEEDDDDESGNVQEHDVVVAIDNDNYHDLEGGDNEAIPLMNVEFFSHELEKVIGANHEITEEVVDDDHVVNATENNIEDQTKRRVTLADLFLEDSDYHPTVKVLKELEDDVDDAGKDDDINAGKLSVEMTTLKPTSRSKYGISKAKKLIKEDLHPLKNFNKLMKRMMKKKIHPDIEGKMQRDVQMNPICGLSNPTNDQDAPNNELASLLLIQDVVA
ncbi:protein TILLER ANGLE CONTROL 1 isoform X2 [Spinacia oleracea]|uniref:Protein TILLER ANGLE CONTROL 1 n=1 Tax=Spinacia oleracea TaxID=3562 RepID=A0A9R0J1Z2_SPIOL|nr:protein TILLER ANGLE CONTROL 1 isoform X2 [Spinacia oleracea]